MKTKNKLLAGIALTLLAETSHAQLASITMDPSNLIQNTISALKDGVKVKQQIQQLTGQKKQIKAENQTVAEAIGIDEATNTSLNRDMALLKYDVGISPFAKEYAKSQNISKLLTNVKNNYNSAVSYFESNTAGLGATQIINYENNFKQIATELKEIDTEYNTVFAINSTGLINNPTLDPSTYSSDKETIDDKSASVDADLKAYTEKYNERVRKIEDEIEYINEQLEGATKKEAKTGNKLLGLINENPGKKESDNLNAALDVLNDKLRGENRGFEDFTRNISSGIGGAAQDIFGLSDAKQKGQGKSVKIDAKNGLLTDAERVTIANNVIEKIHGINGRIDLILASLSNSAASYSTNKMIEAKMGKTYTSDIFKGYSEEKSNKALIDALYKQTN